jgi:hypothetical protein
VGSVKAPIANLRPIVSEKGRSSRYPLTLIKLEMNGLRSIIPPSSLPEIPPPKVGDEAPPLSKLVSDKPAIVAFLRHIGCPFAEKTFIEFRGFAEKHDDEYQYIAITHGTEADTNDFIQEIGGAGNIDVISDPDREIYGKWVYNLVRW